jgi:hypothetical protein
MIGDVSCWELVLAACAPQGAVKARAALLGSHKLKAELRVTLDALLLQIMELHQVPFSCRLDQFESTLLHQSKKHCMLLAKFMRFASESRVRCMVALLLCQLEPWQVMHLLCHWTVSTVFFTCSTHMEA